MENLGTVNSLSILYRKNFPVPLTSPIRFANWIISVSLLWSTHLSNHTQNNSLCWFFPNSFSMMICGTVCWWSSRPHILTIKTLVDSRTDLDPAYMEKTGLSPAGPVKELLTYLCYIGFPYKTWRTVYMRKESLARLGRLPAQPGHSPSRVTLLAGSTS